MSEGFQLREVFNPTIVKTLAETIQHTWPAFEVNSFTEAITPYLAELSFGDRNGLIRDTLRDYLPPDFPKAAQILIDSLGPELSEPELTGFEGFIIMPQCDFIAKYGLNDYDISMKALYEMTKRFTAEGAIRAFLQKYPTETLAHMAQWVVDENCHVRRLVSEGTRPRLPLAPRLPQFIKDPTPVLKLLDRLKTDPVLLVRRSVANNLNDIAKDNPEVVVDTLRAWQKIENEGTHWIIGHASRTLIKQGHQGALELLGYPPNPAIKVRNLSLEHSTIKLGEGLVFSFDIQSKVDETQSLMVDYVIHHMKANGKLAPKVFKLRKKQLKAGETISITKKHAMRPISTRKYYSGRHLLQIQINGSVQAEIEFELKID